MDLRELVVLLLSLAVACTEPEASFCSAPGTPDTKAHLTNPANQERTFIMVKPDGVQRGLVGEIVARFERKGFKLVALKFMQVMMPFCWLVSGQWSVLLRTINFNAYKL